MKILRLIASVNPADGGTIESLVNSSARLQEFGHAVEVASLDLPGEPWLKGFAFPLHALGQSRSVYGYSPRMKAWLAQHVQDYDVAIIEGIWQYHTVAAADACRRKGVPYFVFAHGMLDPWFKRTYPFKHLKKLPYWFLLLRGILRDAVGVIFTVDEERRLARESFPFYRCREVVVSFGTADQTGRLAEQKQQFLQTYPQWASKPFCLFLGRIHPKKGVDILIDAFATACGGDADRYLVIVGPDETGWQKSLQAQVDKHHLHGRVIFTGQLRGDLKWGAFACADCFVLPSHQENFGISVAEALSAGVPVLISDKVNIYREVLADGAGLVSDDTAPAFAGVLADWQAMNEAEKAAMREQARACFLKRFEITRAAQSLEEVLLNAKT